MLGTPDDAYRFARGEAIGFGPWREDGEPARRFELDRPLDFAAVTDHAEWIGEVSLCTTEGSAAYASAACRRYRGEESASPVDFVGKLAGRMSHVMGSGERNREICGPGGARCRASLRSAWQDIQRATEQYHDDSSACSFTALHGWEYSNSVALSKVHRNVIFRNAAVPELPISSLEAPHPIELWDRLDATCTNTDSGCEAVTIPHNSNVSNGRLFEITWKGERPEEQRRQARVRARMERVVEMMQVKGESECKNGLYGVVGGPDELCDFEKIRGIGENAPVDCEEGIGSRAILGAGCQSRVDFVRYALVEGLREQERIGVNPFAFGFIGSTDGHNANPGDTEEDSYDGCCANTDATAGDRLKPGRNFAGRPAIARNPGGLMGVWATENSRDAIFDAIVRRETFATSGPRMTPRFFGGWGLPEDLCEQRDWVEQVDPAGVPMGGVLDPSRRSDLDGPSFIASVQKDPGLAQHPGGQLDRLQIIKVWYGDDGRMHQSIHDVAGRVAEDPGRAAPSVDLATCALESAPERRGRDSLCAVWSDPAYDPEQAAIYYARVVEDPSCRWSWRQCLAFPEEARPATCSDPSIPKLIQERAWTSPIWAPAESRETEG